jgi:hypothetical protein
MLLVAASIKPDRESTHGLRFANATNVTGVEHFFCLLVNFQDAENLKVRRAPTSRSSPHFDVTEWRWPLK